MRVRQLADLDHWTQMRRCVDELAVSYVEARVGDLLFRSTEKQQITGPEDGAVHRNDSGPGSLQVGISRHDDAALPFQHLREAGAIEAECGCASPEIGKADKSPAEVNHGADAEFFRIQTRVAALQPGRTFVRKADL